MSIGRPGPKLLNTPKGRFVCHPHFPLDTFPNSALDFLIPRPHFIMKRLFLAASVLGLSVSASAQGYVALDNNASTNRSPSATSSGLFFHNTINQWTAVLLSGDFNAAFYGGTDSANLSLIASFSGAAAAGSAFFGDGTWTDPQGRSYTVPGLEYTPANSSGTAFFKVEAWVGSATSYAAAVAAGAPTG